MGIRDDQSEWWSKFSDDRTTTGQKLDGHETYSPTWMGNEARNTGESGIEFTENRHDPLPIQPGGRKRHTDDDTLLRTYADRPKNTRNIPWDGPHKRILFESEDPESTLSGSETQEVRPGWPPDDMCADSTRYRG